MLSDACSLILPGIKRRQGITRSIGTQNAMHLSRKTDRAYGRIASQKRICKAQNPIIQKFCILPFVSLKLRLQIGGIADIVNSHGNTVGQSQNIGADCCRADIYTDTARLIGKRQHFFIWFRFGNIDVSFCIHSYKFGRNIHKTIFNMFQKYRAKPLLPCGPVSIVF